MFVVREVHTDDVEAVFELAGFLKQAGYVDSFNLPFDKTELTKRIQVSAKSFEDPKPDKSQALYMFVLEDVLQKKIIGTSLIMAKHGTPEDPHTYLKVLRKTHRDPALNLEKQHTLLRFEYDTDGPSEIGGLILHPHYRGLPLSLGKHLSYARFMYVSMHRDRFENEMIAELLPIFNEDGSSDLWEAFGRRFTDMEYHVADRESRNDKDFIKNLFPQEDIYTCLFSQKVRERLGKTGPTSRAVQHMLEKIGFSYIDAVDPFDGGPHYAAKTSEITLIKRKQKVSLSAERLQSTGNLSLVGFTGSKGFYCLHIHHKLDSGKILLTEEAVKLLEQLQAPINELHLISPI